MAKPWIHAQSSARRFGGKPEDYLEIHQFMDSTKAHLADVRHRAILHSSFGCFLVERIFGVVMLNSDGKEFSPRDVAEQHCIEDMGKIPSIQDWLGGLEIQAWMGPPKHTRNLKAADVEKLFEAEERGFTCKCDGVSDPDVDFCDKCMNETTEKPLGFDDELPSGSVIKSLRDQPSISKGQLVVVRECNRNAANLLLEGKKHTHYYPKMFFTVYNVSS